jgi:hypothetical protein
VRHGVIRIPAGHASGQVTVIADLRLPALAAAAVVAYSPSPRGRKA